MRHHPVRVVASALLAVILLFSVTPGRNGSAFPAPEGDYPPSTGDIGWKAGFTINGVDLPAEVIATDGKNIFVGGNFTTAGNAVVHSIAMWDGSSWHALGGKVFDSVTALAVDGRGHLYAAGKINQVGIISRWDGHEWLSLGADFWNTGGVVHTLAVDSLGRVYAGGHFLTINRETVNSIALWDGSTWHPLAGGVQGLDTVGVVYAIKIDRFGFVYAGGNFLSAGGVPANNIARWDGAGWSPLGDGITFEDPNYRSGVFSLALDGRGNLYVGGAFTQAGGTDALNIACWNGESWSALDGGVTGSIIYNFWGVRSILADGGLVYVAGTFTIAGDTPVMGIARWNGSSWENINAGIWAGLFLEKVDPFAYLTGLAIDRDGRLYASGWFSLAGGKSANHVAVWDGSGWSGLGTDTSVDSLVEDMIPDGQGGAYVAGQFYSAGGTIVNHIAHWDGETWTALGDGLSGSSNSLVEALALDSQGNLYAGGFFSQSGNIHLSSIAKWDGSQWVTVGDGVGAVRALAIDSQDHLYASGVKLILSGDKQQSIAEWTGAQWQALGDGLSGNPAYALAIDGQDRLIAAGSFQKPGETQNYGLARWDGQAWEYLGGADQNPATCLTFHEGVLYLSAHGQVWKILNDQFEKVGDPLSYLGQKTGASVIAFDKQDRMIVGGVFDHAGSVSAHQIARWNGTHWEALGSGLNNWVGSIVVGESDDLIVAGNFSQAGGKVSNNFAIWHEPHYTWLPLINH